MERLATCIPGLFIICGLTVSIYWAYRCRLQKVDFRDILIVIIISTAFSIIAWALRVMETLSQELGG